MMTTKLKRAIWSLAVTFSSWAIFNIIIVCIVAGFQKFGNDWWIGPAFVATYSAALMLVTWFAVLLPLALFLQPKSVFWRWYVCPVIGALTASTFLYIVFGLPNSDNWAFGVIWGGSAGGFTGLLATFTHHLAP